MFRFVHTGDIHLGLKFENLKFKTEDSLNRKMEIWNSFEKLVGYVIENKVEFLFIVGDLFENKYFSSRDIKRLKDILSRATSTNIVIVSGNHDYIHKGSPYLGGLGNNVYIIKKNQLDSIEFKEYNLKIYGYSWESLEVREKISLDYIRNDIYDGKKILLIHGDISGKSNYLPLDKKELEELNVDYIALGHIHKPEFIGENIAYSGSLEPLNFKEKGDRGFILGEVEGDKLSLSFKAFNKRSFFVEEINLDENMEQDNIIEKILEISEESRRKDFYKIRLEGYINKDIDIEYLLEDIREKFYYIELEDNTLLDLDLDYLKLEFKESIVGKFIEEMEKKDLEDPINRKALYYGIEALLENQVY